MNSEPRQQDKRTAAENLAYRRLAAVILRLDVATLADELQSARLQAQDLSGHDLAHAA